MWVTATWGGVPQKVGEFHSARSVVIGILFSIVVILTCAVETIESRWRLETDTIFCVVLICFLKFAQNCTSQS